MKKIILSTVLSLTVFLSVSFAQDVTTVTAKDDSISENLDLKAVASVFGESKDLEDFEKRLNDPELQISNLDLNGDGEVDYLRVVETVKGNTHLISLQAVIGEDQYQDVATIEVEKDDKGETYVQVVGDVYMYGPNYIYEPVYVHPPVLFLLFWRPVYHPWYSPYRWRYYPPYYRPWHPYPTYRYRSNVHVHINVHNTYNYTSVRRSKTSVELQNKVRRNDYGKKHPEKSYKNRNKGISTQNQLNKNMRNGKVNNSKNKNINKSTGRKVQDDWKPPTKTNKKKSDLKTKPKSGKNNLKTNKPPNKVNKNYNTRKPKTKPKGNVKNRKR